VAEIETLIAAVVTAGIEGVTFERARHTLIASLPGGRRQRVAFRTRGTDLCLTSVAASASAVPTDAENRSAFIRRLWEINANTDLVAFGLDGKGRVVGTCTHPLATLDCEELETYLLALVRECDRLEWVITGEDRW
jgi:hypothetical protein